MSSEARREPLISVIIPTRDRAPLLRRSLESLTGQTLGAERFEVLVVDDGSADGTADVCRRFADDLTLSYYTIAPAGTSAAKNLGLYASAGHISLIFDDDDIADPGLLQAHVDAHREHPEENVMILGYTTWAPELDVTPVMRYVMDIGQYLFAYRDLTDGQVLDFTYVWAGRSSGKRSFLAQRGAFNQDLSALEDVELGYRLSRHGLKVVHKRGARSYMIRPITFDDFCRRSEVQGRGRWRFSRLYADPVVQRYTRIEESVRAWPEMAAVLDDKVAAVRDLELRVSKESDPQEELLSRLWELYGWTFEAFRVKGIVDAARDDGVEVGVAEGSADRSRAERKADEADERVEPVTSVSGRARSASLPEICPDPVFIAGSPRSGTSILAWSLAQHSDMCTGPESDILFYLLGKGHVEEAFEVSRGRPDGTWLGKNGVERDEFLRFLGLGLNAMFTSRSEGKRWVDQTPVYTLMLDVIADLFPGAYFLHILRDGRSVVQSMVNFSGVFRDPSTETKMAEAGRLPPWATDFRAACQAWTRFVKTAMRFCERNPERAMVVRNEGLTADADGEFRSILSFIGARHEDGPARFFQGHRINSSFGGGNGQQKLQSERPDPWETWTPEQRAIFVEVAGETMVEHGLATEEILMGERG